MDLSQVFENINQPQQQQQPWTCARCCFDQNGNLYSLCHSHIGLALPTQPDYSTPQYLSFHPVWIDGNQRNLLTSRNNPLSYRHSLCRQPDCQDEFCNDCNHLKPQSPIDQLQMQQQQLLLQQPATIINSQQPPPQSITAPSRFPTQAQIINNDGLKNLQTRPVQSQFATTLAQNLPISQEQTAIIAQPNQYPMYVCAKQPCQKQFCDGINCSDCSGGFQNLWNPVARPIPIQGSLPKCAQPGCTNLRATRNGQVFKFCYGNACGTVGIPETQSQSSISPTSPSPLSTNAPSTPVTATGTPAFTAAIPALTRGIPTLTAGMHTPTTVGPPPLSEQSDAQRFQESPTQIPMAISTFAPPQGSYHAEMPYNSPTDTDVDMSRKGSIASLKPDESIESTISCESSKAADTNKNIPKPVRKKSLKSETSEKSYSGRLCSREGCEKSTFTKNKRAKRFNSYCSEDCFWSESQSLIETKPSLLDKNDSDYASVAHQFKASMKQYRVKGIFRLQMAGAITSRFFGARRLMSNGREEGRITRQLYHGTKSLCDPSAILGGGPFCKNEQCGMCGIVANGNKTSCSKIGGNMCFAEKPESCVPCCNGTKIQAMFLVDVITFDSGPVVDNIDRDDLTLPRFLILFGKN